MCARIAQLILAGLFVFVVVTIAAFRYLEWWQALLASAATFVALITAAKLLIRYAIRNIGEMAKGLFDVKSRVLRGATAQVHAVRPAEPPADHAPDPDAGGRARPLLWYEIEATIFPDPKAAGPMGHWDLDDLRLAPADAAPPSFRENGDGGGDFELHGLRLVADGEAAEPDGSKAHGPRRLRFTVGVPADVRELQFRYYFEQFGRFPVVRQLPR